MHFYGHKHDLIQLILFFNSMYLKLKKQHEWIGEAEVLYVTIFILSLFIYFFCLVSFLSHLSLFSFLFHLSHQFSHQSLHHRFSPVLLRVFSTFFLTAHFPLFLTSSHLCFHESFSTTHTDIIYIKHPNLVLINLQL